MLRRSSRRTRPAPTTEPGGRTELRISVRPYARFIGIGKAVLAFLALLGAIGVIADAGTQLGDDDVPETIVTLVIVVAAIGGGIAARVMWSNLRSAVVRKTTLAVGPEGLTIEHEGIFRKPVTVAWDDVRIASVDDRPAFRRGRDHPRFRMPVAEEREPGWLYSPVSGSPLPLLSQVPDAPNLAILFERPVVLGPARRFVKAFPSKQIFFPPLHNRPSRGFLAHVRDPLAAASALASFVHVRPLVPDDLPSPETSSLVRARKLSIRDNAVLGALIVGQFALPIAIAAEDPREPPGSETFSALGRICGANVVEAPPFEPSSADLGDLLPKAPEGTTLMFDSPIDLSDAALFSRTDVAGWTKSLLDASYDKGYARRWASPGEVAFATVWEFESAESAEDFEVFARNDLCPFVQDAFLVAGIEDAVGATISTGSTHLDQVIFLRGRFRFTVGIETPAATDHTAVTALAQELAAAL